MVPLSVLALHGFTGSGADFAPIEARTPRSWTWHTPDLPGHGERCAIASDDWFGQVVSELTELLERMVEPRLVLGYSMGGRTALRLALAAPKLIDALVLVGAHPGIEDPEERLARQRHDDSLAGRVLDHGVESFLRYWASLPIIATQQRIPASIREPMTRRRLSNRPEGLAASLRGMGTGVMVPAWQELSRLTMPVTLVAGEEDAKYRALQDAMLGSISESTSEVIGGVGHCAHLEDIEAFVAVLQLAADRIAR